MSVAAASKTSLRSAMSPTLPHGSRPKPPPGRFMDAATYDAVRAHHPDAERRDLELKGKAAPVETFAICVR